MEDNMEWLSKMTTANLAILAGVFLTVFFPIIVLIWKRGVKGNIMGKTIEISGDDGEKQQVDTNGLMYVMNDTCNQIQQRKKERIDAIIPDLAEKFETISSLSCLELKVESILHDRRRRNGFNKLASEQSIRDYINDLCDTLSRGIHRETSRVATCSAANPEINDAAIRPIAQEFALQTVRACIDEYREKKTLYEQFLPLYQTLGDKIRVEFCKGKIDKHDTRVKALSDILDKIEGLPK